MKLTEKELKKLFNKQYDKAFEVSDRDSISIRVSIKGKIAWQYRFRFNNKPIRLTLGYYPDLNLNDLRSVVPELKSLLLEGKNPKLVWKQKRGNNKQKAKFTLMTLVDFWFKSAAETEYNPQLIKTTKAL